VYQAGWTLALLLDAREHRRVEREGRKENSGNIRAEQWWELANKMMEWSPELRPTPEDVVNYSDYPLIRTNILIKCTFIKICQGKVGTYFLPIFTYKLVLIFEYLL